MMSWESRPHSPYSPHPPSLPTPCAVPERALPCPRRHRWDPEGLTDSPAGHHHAHAQVCGRTGGSRDDRARAPPALQASAAVDQALCQHHPAFHGPSPPSCQPPPPACGHAPRHMHGRPRHRPRVRVSSGPETTSCENSSVHARNRPSCTSQEVRLVW